MGGLPKVLGFWLLISSYKSSVVMTYVDAICHRESHLLPARLSAMPGSSSGHSVKLQKEFLKLRPQEDISSICKIEVSPSQVIILGQAEAWLKAHSIKMEGSRGTVLSLCSFSELIGCVFPKPVFFTCILGKVYPYICIRYTLVQSYRESRLVLFCR